MNERTTRSDYAIRLERVLTWLVDHLDETLDLGRLADVACMSPFYYDDPSATPVEALRSEACSTVPDGWTPSGDLERREIRGGRYAVTLYVGPYAELGRAYAWLYGTWLAQSGEEAADAPCVEEYLNDARIVPPAELRTEIWLPLR